MPTVEIGSYQVSMVVFIIIFVVGSITTATFLFATRRSAFVVEEPLSISDCPNTFHAHPGDNKTLDITILNSASIMYEVTLVFALNESAYQESYVTFSNHIYNITPGSHNITAWIFVHKDAKPAWLELNIDFYRR